ncbi:hypothetical protein C2E23DRAFT_836909 [Lenzites betulinus]|nr:hypothetical protein C2E23DRAFT_836909 [Lenzites betulinus]
MSDDILDLHLSLSERIERTISRLATLPASEVPLEDSCPICLTPFESILEDKGPEGTEGAIPDADQGITKLEACGHIFCRPCMVQWIQSCHGSCPSCRNVFSTLEPPSDSDNESSDGDYEPGEDEDDDEDEDDGFLDSDGFMETESVFDDDMELDEELFMAADRAPNEVVINGAWDDEPADADMDNWGLSDGEGSESLSEVEILALSTELLQEEDGADVYSDGAEASESLHSPANESTEPK